jgi:hypothetical protein
MTDGYSILINKLDEFIRKYYRNQLIKGGIYSACALLVFYISVTLLEYVGHFGIFVRSTMFYSYMLVNLGILIVYFFNPLLKLYSIGKVINHEQAANIIGTHFTDVRDKLLNTLQLKKLEDANPANAVLIRASIDQKIVQLKPIPFIMAIDISKNRKYLKYAAIPLLFILLLLFAAPSLITGPTKRLLHHGTYFEKEAPFQFVVVNNKLEAVQQEDFLLNVKLTGLEIPENVFIEVDGNRYQLTKESTMKFNYNFKNLQKNIAFRLLADGFYSKDYEVSVIPKPIILNFDVSLSYPAYIRKTNDTLQNTGDIVVPEGTQIRWHFLTKDVNGVLLRFNDRSIKSDSKNENSYFYSSVFKGSQNYSIMPSNAHLTNKDSLTYTISIIPDAYPTIKVQNFKDSVYDYRYYYKGMIKDDYGFYGLTFNYRKLNTEDSSKAAKTEFIKVKINNAITQQEFYYFFDFSTIATQPGDEYEYYFEVKDNDGVNGSKTTRSQKLSYKLPSLEELKKKTEKSNEQIKNDLNKSILEVKELQKEIDELNKSLVDKKTLSWQEKKQVKDLLEKQLNLQDNIDLIQKENFEKTVQEKQFQQENEDLLKKQEELNKLFNELMTDDIKSLFKKLQDMLDKMDKTKLAEMLDKMKLSNKDLAKQLDRNLELFKQLEFEKKMSETIDKLDTLSKKQNDLSKQTEKSNSKNNDSLKNKQERLNKSFDNIQNDLDDLSKKNKELDVPNKLDSTNTEEKNIDQEMDNSLNDLKNNKNKKASQSQKSAADQMKDLSDKLEKMKEDNESESQGEDIESLRAILENLVRASFDQEDLMTDITDMKITDPKYLTVIQDQKNLQDDLEMIEDSLFALSKRQVQIKTFVNQEITAINDNIEKAITYLNARCISLGKAKQQLAMTSINNLALMLSETLTEMEKQQSQSQCSSGKCKKPGNCNKPGNGKPSFKSLKKLQQQLNDAMEELKKGTIPMGSSMSEQLAILAAQQEAIRTQLQKLIEQLKEEGKTKTGNMNDVKAKMEETEKDLVNKIIDTETIKRQKDILTRLLESEKADKERELDEKRESNEAKNEIYSNPNKFFEYNSVKTKEVELLKTIPPSLKTFYKNKVNEYFYNFED